MIITSIHNHTVYFRDNKNTRYVAKIFTNGSINIRRQIEGTRNKYGEYKNTHWRDVKPGSGVTIDIKSALMREGIIG